MRDPRFALLDSGTLQIAGQRRAVRWYIFNTTDISVIVTYRFVIYLLYQSY